MRFVEAVIGIVISTTQAASGSPGRGLVIEISRPFGLFCRNTSETHALVGKKDCGASKEKLSELEDWVKTPSLEEQNSSAEKADGGKKDVVIAGQRWLEAAHEIQHCAANGQHDSNNAGPVETGVNHVEAPGKRLSALDETRSDVLILRSVSERSEFAIDAVGLAQEKQTDGCRNNNNDGTPDQAAEEIGEGGGHSEYAGADDLDETW